MEERMIKMSKSGQGYFWIGGPGEEAFNVCLGLQVKKGQGPAYDFLHLHYRNSATLVAMGMPLVDGVRQMAMTATDTPFDGPQLRRPLLPPRLERPARHVRDRGAVRRWRRARPWCRSASAATASRIVTGGDAGTAEGDFASCMVWSTRPGNELPVLIVVTNNGYGISTPASSQHGEMHIIDRGKAFGIPGEVVDGNDPMASWHAIRRAMAYCRRETPPVHAGGDGVPAARPFVVERRRPGQGRAGRHGAVRAEADRRRRPRPVHGRAGPRRRLRRGGGGAGAGAVGAAADGGRRVRSTPTPPARSTRFTRRITRGCRDFGEAGRRAAQA